LPSPCIEEELLGNRNIAHGRATSRIRFYFAKNARGTLSGFTD
jgi:hypothetical protein